MVCGDLGEPVERAEQTLTGSHCRQEQADVQQSVRFKGRSIRLAKLFQLTWRVGTVLQVSRHM